GDPAYDELPWVDQMLAHTRHPLVACRLDVDEVPALAESVQAFEDEPFGGLPTLAYAKLFERARADGGIVLLDGQGRDAQWAGYAYAGAAVNGGSTKQAPPCDSTAVGRVLPQPTLIQGTTKSVTRPECLSADFRALADVFDPPSPFPDRLRNLQYRD